MKKVFLMVGIGLLLVGCGKSSEKELTPEEVSHMTESEREAEINKILEKVGTQLPENWREMSKQEQGLFILKYGLGVEPDQSAKELPNQ
ncbi:hypothetical protein K9L27_03230 [Candidatus Gracilibacteria bacterium]|nr:hypothetical protein [Candidatus Gracilibacteria bacterium]